MPSQANFPKVGGSRDVVVMETPQRCCPVPITNGEDAGRMFDEQRTRETCTRRVGQLVVGKSLVGFPFNPKVGSLIMTQGSHCSCPASGTMGPNTVGGGKQGFK